MKTIIACAIAWLACVAACADDQFILYGDEQIGTRLRPELGVFPVPLDKPYHEMEERHQAIIRADYGDMSADVQPPFPRRGLAELYRPLLQANREYRDAGELMAVATVDKKGKVANVALYKTPSQRMGKLAGRLIMLTEFEPGRCADKACGGEFLLALSFDP